MLKKKWTFEEASAVFPEVKRITETYYQKAYLLSKKINDTILPENVMEEIEDRIRATVAEWSKTITSMEIDVKGVWLIDFDNGNGYYCWRLGEEDLLYEHSYEDGFAGRKLIQRDL